MSPKPTLPLVMNCSTFNASIWVRMKYWLLIFFTFNCSAFISGCGMDIEDPTLPSPPVWVQKSLPEEWPERGIDAHESGGIYIEWLPSVEEDIAAYIIFRAESNNVEELLVDFDILTRIETDSNFDYTFIDNTVEERILYQYKLKAENSSGVLSGYSDSLIYTVLPQLTLNSMFPNGFDSLLNSERRLMWNYSYTLDMEDYGLTILSMDNNLVYRTTLIPGNYTDWSESMVIPDSIVLEFDERYLWRIDVGAKYVSGIETMGSESRWASFRY